MVHRAGVAQGEPRWSMNFLRDTTADGCLVGVWTLIDDLSRECALLVVDRSLPARRVVKALDALLLLRGRPRTIVCDSGPVFVSLALDQWASANHVRLDFIRPGRPVENCFVESLNGKLRAACLNLHHLQSLHEARERLRALAPPVQHGAAPPRTEQRTPAEFAALVSARADPSPSPSDLAAA